MNKPDSKKKLILFFLVLLIATSMRLLYLDKGYNSDEGWLLRAASLKTEQIMPYIRQQFRSIYPPLGIFLLHFWMKVNNHEPWIRLYFVLFGIALCIVLYHIAKLFLDEQFGMVIFFLSAISPMLIWSSQFVRSYSDAAFWSTLSVYFMLRMIKGKSYWKNSLGYVFVSSLSLYTSYITFFILVSQSIFILIFYFKDSIFLKKWFILQIIVAIIFAPCISLLLKQRSFATGIDLKWGERGFQLWGLNVGHYARSIMASFGIDPYFLTTSLSKEHLSRIILISMAIFLFFITALYLCKYFINIKKFIRDKRLIWFFPVLFALSITLYNFLAEIKGLAILSRYFMQQHILFLFIIAGSIYPVKTKSRLNTLMLAVISSIFILSFPGAVKPEFETRKAYHYLEDKVKESDCLLMLRNTNYYLDPQRFNAIILHEYLKKKGAGASYEEFHPSANKVLSDMKNKYKTVWFYRSHGNDEILGGNALIINWLRKNGYTAENIRGFRRIDIIRYQRMD